MPWRSSLGTEMKFPYALTAEYARKGGVYGDLAHEAAKILEEAQKLDMEVILLRQENTRLTHENKFMLKLLQERDDANINDA